MIGKTRKTGATCREYLPALLALARTWLVAAGIPNLAMAVVAPCLGIAPADIAWSGRLYLMASVPIPYCPPLRSMTALLPLPPTADH